MFTFSSQCRLMQNLCNDKKEPFGEEFEGLKIFLCANKIFFHSLMKEIYLISGFHLRDPNLTMACTAKVTADKLFLNGSNSALLHCHLNNLCASLLTRNTYNVFLAYIFTYLCSTFFQKGLCTVRLLK